MLVYCVEQLSFQTKVFKVEQSLKKNVSNKKHNGDSGDENMSKGDELSRGESAYLTFLACLKGIWPKDQCSFARYITSTGRSDGENSCFGIVRYRSSE